MESRRHARRNVLSQGVAVTMWCSARKFHLFAQVASLDLQESIHVFTTQEGDKAVGCEQCNNQLR
jgi:hypothetical protein